MDDRIINLFSLIADQVQHRQELFSNEGKIMDTLITNGYRLIEADVALTLMQELSRQSDDSSAQGHAGTGMRTMSAEERSRFSLPAFSFVMKLAHLGVITEDQREDLIEKALTLHASRVEIADIKALVAANLFVDAQEHEEFLSSALNRKGTAWN